MPSLSVGGVTAYQYGYAWDNARRWKQDIANNLWTWYPCGVACKAGDLVEEQSDLTGQTWATSALYLRGVGCGSGIIRRNSEYHHADPTGTIAVITNASGSIQNSNLYDRFGVLRYDITGSAQTPWRWQGKFQEEEGLLAGAGGNPDHVSNRDITLQPSAQTFGRSQRTAIAGTGTPLPPGRCIFSGVYSCNLISSGWVTCDYACILTQCLTPSCPCPPADVSLRFKLPWKKCPTWTVDVITGQLPVGIGWQS